VKRCHAGSWVVAARFSFVMLLVLCRTTEEGGGVVVPCHLTHSLFLSLSVVVCALPLAGRKFTEKSKK